MKTHYHLRLSAAACTGTPCGCPANNDVQTIVGANPRVRPCSKGRHVGLPLRFTRLILLLAILIPQPSILAQSDGGTFTDPRDGEKYKTVIMPDGKRWMAENLRYRNGLNNPIFSNNTTANTFAALKSTYYCPGPGPLNTSVNQADPLACEYWGALYPFWVAYANETNTAVNTTLGGQGICPPGWHLPTNSEWDGMITAIGGTANAGYLLKNTARGTFNNNQAYKNLWTGSAVANKDSFGFSALAAGLRTTAGAYLGNGTQALFWTSTPNTNGTQASSKIFNYNSDLGTGSSTQNRADALSVRCVEGSCTEVSKIALTMKQNFVNCETESFTNFDTIFFKNATMTRTYSFTLTPDLPNGTWTYVASSNNLPAGVTFSSAPSISVASKQLILNFDGLSDIISNNMFTLKISATNSAYCKIEQVFNINLIKNTTNDGDIISPTLVDERDGKIYKTILLPDGKWWMAENLNYQVGLKFNANSQKTGGDVTTWNTSGTGSAAIGNFWCSGVTGSQTSTLADCETYGALYTWECAMRSDGVGTWAEGTNYTNTVSGNPSSFTAPTRGICPSGWHIPSDAEWGDMLNAVEVQSSGNPNHNKTTSWIGTYAGQKLKDCFLGPPAGYRGDSGSLYYQNSYSIFWSASGLNINNAWYRHFGNGISSVSRDIRPRSSGFSIRCIKN